MPNKLAVHFYPVLLTQIKTTIASGAKNIEHIKALTYWKVGESISKHLLSNNGRAGYGQQLYKKLAKDLNIGSRTLVRTVQFYKEFPIVSARTQLDWSHYRELIAVNDPALRTRLIRKAERRSLSTRQLAGEIRRTPGIQHQASSIDKPIKLTPLKGPLNIYQAIKPSPVTLGQGEILLDLGFNVWTIAGRADIKAGQIVATRAKMSFTYKAFVQEIIDGDTLWVLIDIGFGNYTSQKLRLRGLDCPELNTAAGKKARAFVVKVLKGVEYIIVRSSKSDKYDRYLADVFYGQEEKFLNQQLLDEELAIGYKE